MEKCKMRIIKLNELENELLEKATHAKLNGGTLTHVFNELAAKHRKTESYVKNKWSQKIRKVYLAQQDGTIKQRFELVQEVAEHETPLSDQMINKPKVAKTKKIGAQTIMKRLETFDKQLCNKMDDMHNDIVKYVDRTNTTISREFEVLLTSLSVQQEMRQEKLIENNKKNVAQIDRNGHVMMIETVDVKEVTFSEEHVNKLLNQMDVIESESEKTNEQLGLLEELYGELTDEYKRLEELNKMNAELLSEAGKNAEQSYVTISALENKNLSYQAENGTLNKENDRLNDMINKLTSELEAEKNKTVLEKLFGKNKTNSKVS